MKRQNTTKNEEETLTIETYLWRCRYLSYQSWTKVIFMINVLKELKTKFILTETWNDKEWYRNSRTEKHKNWLLGT